MNPLLATETKLIIINELQMEESQLTDFLLDAIWEYIIDYIGFNPMLGEREELYDGNGSEYLYTRCKPIKSIQEIKVNDIIIKDVKFSDEFINIYTENGFDRNQTTLLYKNYPLTDLVKIKYTAGYEKMPPLLLLAIIKLISSISNTIGETGNLSSYKIDTISYTFKKFSESNEEFRSLINKFISW
ncbi:MAG: hypothetical protein ACRC0F_03705 [Cetobacterium sp.]